MRPTVLTSVLFICNLWTSPGIQITSANYTSPRVSVTGDHTQVGVTEAEYTQSEEPEMSTESELNQNSPDENVAGQSWSSIWRLKPLRKINDNTTVNDTDNSTDLIHEQILMLSKRPSLEIPPLMLSIEACSASCDGEYVVQSKPYCLGLYEVSCSSCNCDQLCSMYGDCCPDGHGLVPKHNMSQYVCVGQSSMMSTGVGYYMIRTCPVSIMSESKDWRDDLQPVTSNITGNVYFNKYYAECNNEKEVEPWLNATVCKPSQDVNVSTTIKLSWKEGNVSTSTTKFLLTWQDKEGQDPNCSFVFIPRSGARNCSWQRSVPESVTIAKCNISGKASYENARLEDLCESTYYPVSWSGKIYKNAYCFFCNLESYGVGECHGFAPITNINRDIVVSFAEVVRLIKPDFENVCTNTEWFDPSAEMCRQVECMDGRVLENRRCLLKDYTISESEYGVTLMLQLPKLLHSRISWNGILTLVSNCAQGMMSNFDPLVYYFTIERLQPKYSNETQETRQVGISFNLCSLTHEQRSKYEDKIIDFIWDDWKGVYNDTAISLNPEPYDYDMQIVTGAYFTYDPFKKVVYSANEYQIWKKRLSSIIDDLPEYPRNYVSLTRAPQCPFITVRPDEYRLHANGSIYIIKSNLTVPKSNYSAHLKSVQICLETFQSLMSSQNISSDEEGQTKISPTTEGYISLVCTCTSILCIVLTLITFLRFPLLRSLANKNTIALSMSLLFAQGSSQFGLAQTHNKTVCKVLGVVIHFFWLTVILWMNVCSFHMFRVFVSAAKATQIQGSPWKILLKYSIYVYTLAIVIVSSTIGANYAVSNGLDIGYGKRVCYISDTFVIGLAFVLPLCLVLVLNAVFFSVTVYTIHRTSKINKNSTNDRSNVFVYIKLSTLTGLFWILALVAEPTRIPALRYISVVLNGCQGVFIFISYVFNRRVFRLWFRSAGPHKSADSQTFSEMASMKTRNKSDGTV